MFLAPRTPLFPIYLISFDFLYLQVLEDRVPFLMGSIKDLQHYVPSSKDSIVSHLLDIIWFSISSGVRRQGTISDEINQRSSTLCS